MNCSQRVNRKKLKHALTLIRLILQYPGNQFPFIFNL